VRLAGLLVLITTGLVVTVVVGTPDGEMLRAFVAAGGAWVPTGFVLSYALATLLLVPKNMLSAAAGFAFGPVAGVLLVWVAALLGAAAAFWLGRGLGRDGVLRLAGGHLDRLDGLVARHGVAAVLLARLVPVVPFTAVNYGSGLTAVGFGPYLLATAIGIVPGTVAYVAVGAYGAEPTGWPFLSAAGVLAALTLGGAWYARWRRRPREEERG
jgi:uncharacterized membrane protein YdjX (TVP38/TMEM64 family)